MCLREGSGDEHRAPMDAVSRSALPLCAVGRAWDRAVAGVQTKLNQDLYMPVHKSVFPIVSVGSQTRVPIVSAGSQIRVPYCVRWLTHPFDPPQCAGACIGGKTLSVVFALFCMNIRYFSGGLVRYIYT